VDTGLTNPRSIWLNLIMLRKTRLYRLTNNNKVDIHVLVHAKVIETPFNIAIIGTISAND